MFYLAISAIIFYAGIKAGEKLERKEELKKAKEEGYEVYFSC